MANINRHPPIAAAVALAGLIAAGAGVALAGKDSSGLLQCEIRDRIQGDMILLEPVLRSATQVNGSYSITVSGGSAGGSSNVSQGGDFAALPGRPTTLGQISLSAGGSYDVKLKVAAAGATIVCASQVPSRT